MSRHLVFYLLFSLATILFSGLIFLHSFSRYWPWEWPVFSLFTFPHPPHPSILSFFRDTKQISRLCFLQVRLEIVWFPIRLSRRVTSLWLLLLTTWHTVASTAARLKGRRDEIEEVIEEVFVWGKCQKVYFKKPTFSVTVKPLWQPIWVTMTNPLKAIQGSYRNDELSVNELFYELSSIAHTHRLLLLHCNAVMITLHNEKPYECVLLEQPNSKSHFMEIG